MVWVWWVSNEVKSGDLEVRDLGSGVDHRGDGKWVVVDAILIWLLGRWLFTSK